MNGVRSALRRPVFAIAFASALAVWAALLVCAGYVVNHGERATLDAAASAVRARLANASAADVRARTGALSQDAARWNASVAAFDAAGDFDGGDASLRGDGLRAAGAATPPSGRLLAVVETKDGYVLVAPSQSYTALLRTFAAGTILLALLCAAAVGLIADRMWIANRARSSALICERLSALDQPSARAIVSADDPLFAAIAKAALGAIDRVSRSSQERAQNEERLRSFLADAGHELRTPLAIAIGYTGILERDAIEDPVLARRIVGDVAREHARLQLLVERILQLARLDAVPGDPNAVCDAVRVAHEAIALVRPVALERAIDVRGAATAWVAIGADDLRDALRNFLENAIRYAPQARIAVEIASEAGGTVVRVGDDGPGMEAFAVTHAFDRFFRGSQSDASPGSGLGLAIVRRIAERAGGEAMLRSTPGAGTVVELRLPNAASA